ncbi:RNA 3'-terminal phosphate cyclase [archaeon]|jgi:RNA 3'-phosphate cyclase|nr:RNA 3'-terminal phosphate cyclase [archaeon]MBT3451244.1 RNA 3'-terminal phosphate cyclase [archaeon]MBT6869099.1 RNA 3'-terminal phosphate cyclase [archaeon]MBT7193342.1 RNA 3'-terminal phosphate cyclase [archaeon]MBT7380350.1 RNA 3'-terminal phosphate cyclase [archaeon]
MVELDGNYGEGGGALLRVALAAATITNTPFRINNIRSGRTKPGLKAQHLQAINALKQISGSKCSEIELGTTELWFQPGKVKGGTYTFDIGTAGSITLFLQSIILPCMFASSKINLTIKGGTCGKWQASVDYLKEILLPQLERFVKKIDLKILKRGYYPKGGGEIFLEISPLIKLQNKNVHELIKEVSDKVKKINLKEQGKLQQVKGVLNISSELSEFNVDERITRSAKVRVQNRLKINQDVPINIRTELVNTLSQGGELLLWSVHNRDEWNNINNPIRLGSSCVLEKGKKSEIIGKETAEQLFNEIESEAVVDHHLADQLIQFMSILPNSVIRTSEITNHTKTNIFVIKQFIPTRFKIENNVISSLLE